jgi:UDP-N-acetylmuramoyl-tripeptide--D-alanyl-D-alanine ligase
MMTLLELARAIRSSTLKGDGGLSFTCVSSDTRTLRPGALFFALRGPNFDAHEFAAQAVGRGAAALVVEHPLDVAVPQLMVPDTRVALRLGAAEWRSRFRGPLIAVTGSNGKTTVTQMIGSVLAAAFGSDRRLVTRGNLNNEIGLPLMLFELAAQHRAAVLEMGMNHVGEIACLAATARPTVAVVNNAQREHQEFLASVEATARENGAVIDALPADGIAVFPADDACAAIWRERAGKRRVIDFARSRGCAAAITATDCVLGADRTDLSISTPAGPLALRLPVPGGHNVHNALAATAAAFAIGISSDAIRLGLESFAGVAGRGVRLRLEGGAVLIDDTYNANPDSVRAAIDLLATCAGPRTLVLGDMGEVGEQGPEFHREVGEYARRRGIDSLLALGELSHEAVHAFGERAALHADVEALIEAVRQCASRGGTLLVKGSRFMRMERVVDAIAPHRSSPAR